MRISIISPVYYAEAILETLVERVVAEMKLLNVDFEIILVEDGSKDKSWDKIVEIASKESSVVGIKLSRNFGQHYAVTAGIQHATGDCMVIMDCDLQDSPSNIKLLYESFLQGNEIIFTKRIKREHGFFKSLGSKIYNLLFMIFSDKKYDIDTGSLIMFGRKAAEAFLSIKDQDRLYIQLFKWIGFQNTTIPVEHHKRYEGKSTYSFFKLLKLGIQGWTSHSDKLLRISIYLGLFISILSFVLAVVVFIWWLYLPIQIGWTSLILSIFFSTGLLLLSNGISGIYIGKTFAQTKERPLYIIEKTINGK